MVTRLCEDSGLSQHLVIVTLAANDGLDKNQRIYILNRYICGYVFVFIGWFYRGYCRIQFFIWSAITKQQLKKGDIP